MNDPAPLITLSNGIRIANFSSPHDFIFTTGEVLPACTPERARALMLEAVEKEFPGGTYGKWTDISLEFRITNEVVNALDELWWGDGDLGTDIILVPLPVMQAVKNNSGADSDSSNLGYLLSKIRCIRVADRVSKTIYPDRFCI